MKFLRLPAVQALTGLSRSSLYQMMGNGTFPKSIAIGSRAIAWTETSIQDWIESRINASK